MRDWNRVRGLLDVVDQLYEASLSIDLWPTALARVANLFDARAAGIRVEEVAVAVRQKWIGLEPDFERAYVEHYWRHDPWAGLLDRAAVGMVGYGDAIADRRVVEKSAFHNELARPFGLDDLAGGLLERSAGRVVSFGIMMPTGRRFGPQDGPALESLAPHLRRALALARRLEGVAPRADSPLPSADVREPLQQMLQRRYRLTVAEAHVAVSVGRGMAPKEVAMARGTSWYTVRAQLRQILAKMELRSQSALAHAVTQLEARITHDAARRGFEAP